MDSGAQHADAFVNNFTQEQNQQFAVEFGQITELMAEQMASGAAVTDASVQELIHQHYEFCSQFWKPNRQSYISLALSYVLPSPYRDSYETVAPGLGQYHYDAIVEWANTNLD
jgi:uncharacterized protein YoaH (UPF0181 family)